MAQARFIQMPAHQTLIAKAQDRKFCMSRHRWSARDSTQGGALRRTLTLAHPDAQMCLLIACARANSYHASNTAKRLIAHAKCDNHEPVADLSRALTITRPLSLTRSALIVQNKSISTVPLPQQNP
jgi:hypothetical protein